MGTHIVKTTIEIADPLLTEAKSLAAREGTTVRALVEEGLRHVVRARRPGKTVRFKLRDASVRGRSGARAEGTRFLDALDEVNTGRR
jgi:Arc/MetJ family transcription regulator